MSLDTLTLRAVVFECRSMSGSTLLGVEQTGPNEVALEFVGPGGRDVLAISVQPEYARLYRAASSRTGVSHSSAFVSAVREHLLRGVLTHLDLAPNPRARAPPLDPSQFWRSSISSLLPCLVPARWQRNR